MHCIRLTDVKLGSSWLQLGRRD